MLITFFFVWPMQNKKLAPPLVGGEICNTARVTRQHWRWQHWWWPLAGARCRRLARLPVVHASRHIRRIVQFSSRAVFIQVGGSRFCVRPRSPAPPILQKIIISAPSFFLLFVSVSKLRFRVIVPGRGGFQTFKNFFSWRNFAPMRRGFLVRSFLYRSFRFRDVVPGRGVFQNF